MKIFRTTEIVSSRNIIVLVGKVLSYYLSIICLNTFEKINRMRRDIISEI